MLEKGQSPDFTFLINHEWVLVRRIHQRRLPQRALVRRRLSLDAHFRLEWRSITSRWPCRWWKALLLLSMNLGPLLEHFRHLSQGYRFPLKRLHLDKTNYLVNIECGIGNFYEWRKMEWIIPIDGGIAMNYGHRCDINKCFQASGTLNITCHFPSHATQITTESFRTWITHNLNGRNGRNGRHLEEFGCVLRPHRAANTTCFLRSYWDKIL